MDCGNCMCARAVWSKYVIHFFLGNHAKCTTSLDRPLMPSRPHMWSRNKINSVLATIYFISAPYDSADGITVTCTVVPYRIMDYSGR